jgi:hypothetical protein
MSSKPQLIIERLQPDSPNLKKDPSKAVIPLPVIKRSNKNEDQVGEVTLFETGIRFEIPVGHHVEITEGPDLWKQGYSLVSTLIISPNEDSASIQIPLLKREEVEDLEINPHQAPVQFKLVKDTEYFVAVVNKGQPQIKMPTKKGKQFSVFL